MKTNLQKIILFIIVFIFVLVFFETKSWARFDWIVIKRGNGSPSDNTQLTSKYGWNSNMDASTTGGTTGGRAVYAWTHQDSGKKYKLEVTYSTESTNWILYSWQEITEMDTDDYKTGLRYGDATYLFDKGAAVLKVLRNIAAIVSVVALSIIGIRYMVGSVEQKAEYKQTMIPVIIGCMLIGGLSAILTLIQSIF